MLEATTEPGTRLVHDRPGGRASSSGISRAGHQWQKDRCQRCQRQQAAKAPPASLCTMQQAGSWRGAHLLRHDPLPPGLLPGDALLCCCQAVEDVGAKPLQRPLPGKVAAKQGCQSPMQQQWEQRYLLKTHRPGACPPALEAARQVDYPGHIVVLAGKHQGVGPTLAARGQGTNESRGGAIMGERGFLSSAQGGAVRAPASRACRQPPRTCGPAGTPRACPGCPAGSPPHPACPAPPPRGCP